MYLCSAHLFWSGNTALWRQSILLASFVAPALCAPCWPAGNPVRHRREEPVRRNGFLITWTLSKEQTVPQLEIREKRGDKIAWKDVAFDRWAFSVSRYTETKICNLDSLMTLRSNVMRQEQIQSKTYDVARQKVMRLTERSLHVTGRTSLGMPDQLCFRSSSVPAQREISTH